MREKNKTLITPEGYTITFYDEESVEIKLEVPKETFETLRQIAEKRGLSVESVVKFFIGKGMRDSEPELAKELALKRLKSRKAAKENQEVDLAA